MAAYSSTTLTISVLLMLLFSTLSSASDMSIITYDENHIPHRTDNEVAALFESWLIEHGKSYNALGEKDKRFQIFKDSLKYIDEHNSVPNKTYKLGLTQFADLTNEEYRSMYLSTKISDIPINVSDRYLPKVGDILPASVDWRKKGVLVGVKNQGPCGSCWAFAAVASIESRNAIVTGELISLSEQQLVDCDRSSVNKGCNMGAIPYAFEYVIKNGGINSEKNYPYIARDGICDRNKERVKVVSIDGYEMVPPNDEKALQKAVVSQPVSIVMEAGGTDFRLYRSGIFTGRCGTDVDHGVVVVGYGTESGMDYWIVRNSWGANWGENGYFRIQRNVASPYGLCGLAIESSYAVKTVPPPPPAVICDDGLHRCPAGSTCCCAVKHYNTCNAYTCCPVEGATCCENNTCCPPNAPVCNIQAFRCEGEVTGSSPENSFLQKCKRNSNPLLGVKAMRAEPIQAFGDGGGKSSS